MGKDPADSVHEIGGPPTGNGSASKRVRAPPLEMLPPHPASSFLIRGIGRTTHESPGSKKMTIIRPERLREEKETRSRLAELTP